MGRMRDAERLLQSKPAWDLIPADLMDVGGRHVSGIETPPFLHPFKKGITTFGREATPE